MKGASWLVAGGTVAGLVAVLSYHSEVLPAAALTGSASTAQGPSPSPSATAGKANPTAAGPPAATGTATAMGPTEQFGYGQLAVEVTLQNGRITKVTVPTLQVAEPMSQTISQQAIPTLTSEILSAQSLSVNAVSGATYTSEAYGQSLQAALNKLHFR